VVRFLGNTDIDALTRIVIFFLICICIGVEFLVNGITGAMSQ